MATKILVNQPSLIAPETSLLPVQQNPKTNTAKIEDEEGRLLASGAIIRFTNNQAYFVLQHIDPDFHKKAITVLRPDETQPFNMRVKKVYEKHANRSFLPMYIQVHFNPEERLPIEHIVDLLADKTLGNNNLELRKNVTIDIFDSDADPYIRDKAGFIVTDRLRFEQITVAATHLQSVLSANKEYAVSEAKEIHWDEILGFDGTLSNHQRSEFLLDLYSKRTNQVFVAHSTQQNQEHEDTKEIKAKKNVAGYAVVCAHDHQSSNLQMLCLYAATKEIAESLVHHILLQPKYQGFQKVVFSTYSSKWESVRTLASFTSRPIYRRHTRTIPVNIKWEQIFALNVGLNLF